MRRQSEVLCSTCSLSRPPTLQLRKPSSGAYVLFAVLKLAVWSHVGVALLWLLTMVGAGLVVWQWKTYWAAHKADATFAQKGRFSNFIHIPLIGGTVMTIGDAANLIKAQM